MLDLFRDPIWQFIGATLALVSVAVAVIFFLMQRSKKALAYEILTYTPLVTVNEDAKDQIEIRFKGTPVANVYLLLLRLWNNGNVSILPGDFIEPLVFRLPESAEILTAEVVQAEPDSLKPELHLQGAALTIAPLLLNGRDTLTLKLLIVGGEAKPVVKCGGRIAGVKAVMRLEPSGDFSSFIVTTAFQSLGVNLILCPWIAAFFPGPNYFPLAATRWTIAVVGTVTGMILIFLTLMRRKRYRPG
jgi:hypothetical protein